MSATNIERLIDDFAIRSFRDRADEDYISARMSFRAELPPPSLWSSLQAVEKYLKCILLLSRIPCKQARHNLILAVDAINSSSKVALDLTPGTMEFIKYLNEYGSFRYLEVSNVAFGRSLTSLDRAVWELRRFCSKDGGPSRVKLRHGVIPPKFHFPGGCLEAIIDDVDNPAREPLLWQNAFFGKRQRRRVALKPWLKAENAPLYLNPQILDEIVKYVHLPKRLVEGYRDYAKLRAGTEQVTKCT